MTAKLTLDDFLQARELSDLGPEFSRVQSVLAAWTELCRAELDRQAETILATKPKCLDCVEVETEGVTFRLYGVVHGWTGGPSQEYRDLVEDTLETEATILFEKMLGYFYMQKDDLQIPDFWVLGAWGQMILGLRAMATLPLFVIMSGRDVLRELLTKKEPPIQHISQVFDSVRYHNIDPELRRGLGDSLPTRLQIEYELSRWPKLQRYLDLDLLVAVVPRSGYIAEFARRYARQNKLTKITVVVGDRHLTEVEHFLTHPIRLEKILKAARRHADWISRCRYCYHLLFSWYMLMLTAGAAIGSIPYLVLVYLLAYS